jgi:UDP-N-acetylmuramyl tripeptide synthase
MLAKNPAGWSELLDLVGNDDGPIVISINARTADGADPSWLWDVPFERLGSRVVVATGDRCRDLSVRLHYAGVAHVMEVDPLAAVRSAHDGDGAPVDVIGNYTAFDELLRASVPPRVGS